MGNPVVHWEIIGKNGPRLQQFYSQVFGWTVNADNPMGYGLVDGKEVGGVGGGIAANSDGRSQYVTIYVAVPDLQAHLDKIQKLGGKTVQPPTEIPGMVTFALFTDPDGNLVGLIKA